MSNKELQPYFRLFSKEKRLTVQEEEAILNAVIAENKMHRRVGARSGGFRLLRVAVVGVALLLIVPLAAILLPDGNDQETFTERGGEQASFAPQCIGTHRNNGCRIGETLVFRINAPLNRHYFAVFAVHKESEKLYWYYPSDEAGIGIEINRERKRGILTRGIRIGPEHRAGRYIVYGVFSENALNRAALRKMFVDGKPRNTTAFSVVEALLDIE